MSNYSSVMPEGEKVWGAGSKGWADRSALMVGIGLTDLPNIGGGAVAPGPPVPTSLILRICYFQPLHFPVT